jgi:hypothetical protein
MQYCHTLTDYIVFVNQIAKSHQIQFCKKIEFRNRKQSQWVTSSINYLMRKQFIRNHISIEKIILIRIILGISSLYFMSGRVSSVYGDCDSQESSRAKKKYSWISQERKTRECKYEMKISFKSYKFFFL